MKKVRINMALCALLVALGVIVSHPGTALAQDQSDRERGPMVSVDEQLKGLSAQLNLTEEQRAAIKPILEEERQQLLAKDDSLSREDRTTNKRRIREKAGSKIRELLTDEQKPKFDQMEKERRERMNSRKEKSESGSQ